MKHRIAGNLTELAVEIDIPQQDSKNARKDHNLDGIKKSLDKYGQRRPVVVNKRGNAIEAGNGVHRAAKELGWTHIAAVFVDDDPRSATGYAIADNRLGDQSSFDDWVLSEIFDEFLDPTEIPGVDDDFLAIVQANAMILGDIDEQLSSPPETSNERKLGDKGKQIKPVLYVDELAIFEKAIKRTGIKNRGQAVIEICRYYLDEKGQHDLSAESLLEAEGFGELL